MRQRDKAILDDLSRFRCMTRDDIAEIHFSTLKSPITSANIVLKRLRRDGYIEANTERQPYVYFPSPAPIKKDSSKINHYLAIVDFYKQSLKHDIPRQFKVEPKYGKEYMEPDIFMIWQGAAFFVEIQRSIYSEKVMKDKLDRYEKYLYAEEWKKESWQPRDKKIFPYIWIITETRYDTSNVPYKTFQTRNVEEFLMKLKNGGFTK